MAPPSLDPPTLLKVRENASPKLLVSVRNEVEAIAALAGGCDVLDIKEPQRGPLGMAAIEDIAAIAQTVNLRSPHTLLSLALGEIDDWKAPQLPQLPGGITFAKLGPARLANPLDWRKHWSDVRQRFDESSGRQLSWIAVAYADCRLAHSPPPQEILAATLAEDCAGMLIDTCTKSGRGLFDWISVASLRCLAEQAHAHGKILALAGQISRADLPNLQAVNPDIIAIRSAACRDGIRTHEIHADAVREFKTAIETTFAPTIETRTV